MRALEATRASAGRRQRETKATARTRGPATWIGEAEQREWKLIGERSCSPTIGSAAPVFARMRNRGRASGHARRSRDRMLPSLRRRLHGATAITMTTRSPNTSSHPARRRCHLTRFAAASGPHSCGPASKRATTIGCFHRRPLRARRLRRGSAMVYPLCTVRTSMPAGSCGGVSLPCARPR